MIFQKGLLPSKGSKLASLHFAISLFMFRAAEQLVGLASDGEFPDSILSSIGPALVDEVAGDDEESMYLLAKSIFDLKEYMRCVLIFPSM